MVIDASLWPSRSCTVLVPYPDCGRWVAIACRRRCGENAQVKAELAAKLTRVKVLSGLTVKLTGTYGTAGGAVTGGIEFTIPGS